jgi:lysophospholipase L1-like esterase
MSLPRFFALRRLWDTLADPWATRLARRPSVVPLRPPPLRCEAMEERVTPDGRPHPSPVLFFGGGPGAPAVVRAHKADTGELVFSRNPFGSTFAGGVRVAAGDISGDGYPDVVAAAGPGGGPHVQVLDGTTGEPIAGPLGSFFAYGTGFTGGVSVSSADVDGDGYWDVVTAAGPGGGPHVKVFSGKTGVELASFLAFDPDFKGGATVVAADFSGDGKPDLAVGAGAGGGPHVKVFDGLTGQTIPGPLASLFAFDKSFTGGVSVAGDSLAADVTGDGRADLVVGAGPGGGPHVKVFDGATGAVARDFFAFDPGMAAGVRVGTAFVTDDQYADIVCGTGSGLTAAVRVFDGRTLAELPAPMMWLDDVSVPPKAVNAWSAVEGFFPDRPNTWRAVHKWFLDRTKQGDIDAVFFGDSLTQGWPADLWATHFQPLKAVNFGLAEDGTSQVLWRIENGELYGYTPKVVVVMVGINNVRPGHTAEDTAKGVGAILAAVRKKQPEAKVLLLGVLPIWEKGDDIRKWIAAVNGGIGRLADGDRVRFLDLGPKVLERDGSRKAGFYATDRLHLAEAGYEALAPDIAAAIKEAQK